MTDDRADRVSPAPSRTRPFDARSLLFVPGSRPDRFAKAIASGADAICIDLEDAVAADLKPGAREEAMRFVLHKPAGAFVCVRINGLRTAEGLRDLLALAHSGCVPGAVLLPKTQSADELRLATEVSGGPGHQHWVPLIESAAGLQQVAAIASVAPDLAAIMFGGADFSADVGCAFEWDALALARQQIVIASSLARLPCIDVPFLPIDQPDELMAETRRAAALGFTCKAAIHPSQVDAIHGAFQPTTAQLDRARRIVAAAEVSRGGALQIDGQLADGPVIAAARRTLRRAAAAGS